MIDLHLHTKASDGDLTPEELIDLAITKGIKTIAITDHDTIDGLESAIQYSKGKDIFVIPGVELEATTQHGQMHIVGLFIDYKNKDFIKKIDQIHLDRVKRNEIFIKEFNKMGFDITIEELQEVSDGKTIGKPHFAKLFLRKNYIQTKSEMFDNYFNKPPLNKYKKGNNTAKEIIEAIKKCGGIVILAHPQSLKLSHDELVEKIKELKSYGLDGLECYHSLQTPEQMVEFKQIALDLDLIYSKASDYHGPITKPDTQIGTGNNNNIVNDEEDFILNQLLTYYVNGK